MNNNNIWEDILCIILAIILITFLVILDAWIAMLLWNSIVVPIFGLPILSIWETLGIIIIIRLFFPFNFNYNYKKKD